MSIMVDLEGTLSDHTDRLRVLEATTAADPKNRDAWKTYYKGLINDHPRHNVMYVVRQWIAEGTRPLVYSTRFSNKYNHEEEWLRGHELWEHVDLLQRDRSTEHSFPGPQLVAIWAAEIKPEILVDDREEVRHLVSITMPSIKVFGPQDFNHHMEPA